MIVRYNSLNRFEKPKLTLCNPGSEYFGGRLTKVVGILTDCEAEEVVLNFNSTSELNFRINLIHREDAEEDAHICALYKAVQNRRLIFMEDIGYFMITSIEDGREGEVQYKDVKAQSIDIEIQLKMIPYIEDNTYRFLSDNSNNGILDEVILHALPSWTVGHVDNSVASKFRTFEDVDSSLNCLAFMLENMQDAYECIIIFDIINRVINVYDQSNYVERTNIHITKDDLINSLEINENADDLYTAISVMGDENVTIAAVNPLGTNVIYNFDYYLDWMSDGLRTAVEAWQNAVNSRAQDYLNKNTELFNKRTQASNCRASISKYEGLIKLFGECKANIVAESTPAKLQEINSSIQAAGGENDDAITFSDNIESAKAQFDSKIKKYTERINDGWTDSENKWHQGYRPRLEALEARISDLESSIESIHNDLSIKTTTRLTEEQHHELDNYIFEGSYTDEYITITEGMSYEEQFEQMKTLYNRAKSQLERISTPTQEFNIDVDNFIFTKDFSGWLEQLKTGCLINVELDTDDIAELFLSNITVNYDDHKLNMTFGNRFNKFDPKSLFNNVLGKINKSANTLNYMKNILFPIKNGDFNYMKEALATSRNLTMLSALSSNNEEVVIDSSGYTGRSINNNGDIDPHQIKIVGKSIVFTDDAWETCKTAVGEIVLDNGDVVYGVNAEALIGDVIMGNELHIFNNDGYDIFDVMDNKITTTLFGNPPEVLFMLEGIPTMTSVGTGHYKSTVTLNATPEITEGATLYFNSTEYPLTSNGDGEYVFNTNSIASFSRLDSSLPVYAIKISGSTCEVHSNTNTLSNSTASVLIAEPNNDGGAVLNQYVTNTEFTTKFSNLNEITTSTGYTFNADGLTIYKESDDASDENAKIKNLLNNQGMYVTQIVTNSGVTSEENVLTANNDGVNAINLTARQYLIAGNYSRFEDFERSGDTKRTGCYYIGD